MFINNLKAGITILHDTATQTDHHLSLAVGCTQKEILENGYPLLEDKGFIDSAIFWKNTKDPFPGQGKQEGQGGGGSTEAELPGEDGEASTGDGVNGQAGQAIAAPKITVVGTIAPIALPTDFIGGGLAGIGLAGQGLVPISQKEIDPKFIFCENQEEDSTVSKSSGTSESKLKPPAAQTITITIPGKDGKTAGTGQTGKPATNPLLDAKIKFLQETQPDRKNLEPPFTTTNSDKITKSRWMYGAHWVRYSLVANAVFLMNHTGGFDITFVGKPMLRSPNPANPYACVCPIFLKPEDGQLGMLAPVPGSNPIFLPLVLPEPNNPDAVFTEFVEEGGVIPPTPEGIGGGLAGDLLDIAKFKNTLKTQSTPSAATAEVNITVTDTQAPSIFETFFELNFDIMFRKRMAQALGFGTTIEGENALFDAQGRIKLKFQECGQAPPVTPPTSGTPGSPNPGGNLVVELKRDGPQEGQFFTTLTETLALGKVSENLFKRTGSAQFNGGFTQTQTLLFFNGTTWSLTHITDETSPRTIFFGILFNTKPSGTIFPTTVFPTEKLRFATLVPLPG